MNWELVNEIRTYVNSSMHNCQFCDPAPMAIETEFNLDENSAVVTFNNGQQYVRSAPVMLRTPWNDFECYNEEMVLNPMFCGVIENYLLNDLQLPPLDLQDFIYKLNGHYNDITWYDLVVNFSAFKTGYVPIVVGFDGSLPSYPNTYYEDDIVIPISLMDSESDTYTIYGSTDTSL